MNTLCKLFFIINTICILASIDAAPATYIIRGRVTFPGGSRTPIESGATLSVALQDTSLADAPAKVIAKGTGKAVRFPIAFAIKYSSLQVKNGLTYSLSVTIRNKKNELLYINDVYIPVKPLGNSRTKFIDAPVILVKETTPVAKKEQWPELVGRKGTDAVQIIKKETGLTNVTIIREGSPMTLDYRTDRVRVIVNSKGVVTRVPSIG